jgi:thiol-disulfide isomerase/thioredoxin
MIGVRRSRLIVAVFLPLIAASLFGAPGPVRASAPITTDKAMIYLFWGDGCPHCAAEKPFLEDLARQFPKVELHLYEVWQSQENQDIFRRMAVAHGFEPKFVPTTFLGTQYWEGFDETVQRDIAAAVSSCLASGCPDAGLGIIGRTPAAAFPPAATCDTCVAQPQTTGSRPKESDPTGDWLTALVVIIGATGFLALAFLVGRGSSSGGNAQADSESKPESGDRDKPDPAP